MAFSVESNGKTIEQALQKALKELSARPEDVDIEILSESQGGLLGIFGSKNVKIRVSLRGTKPCRQRSQPAAGTSLPDTHHQR